MKWKLMIGAVAAAALAAAGGIAYAAATGGTPSGYDACAKTQNGLLRQPRSGEHRAAELRVARRPTSTNGRGIKAQAAGSRSSAASGRASAATRRPS